MSDDLSSRMIDDDDDETDMIEVDDDNIPLKQSHSSIKSLRNLGKIYFK